MYLLVTYRTGAALYQKDTNTCNSDQENHKTDLNTHNLKRVCWKFYDILSIYLLVTECLGGIVQNS